MYRMHGMQIACTYQTTTVFTTSVVPCISSISIQNTITNMNSGANRAETPSSLPDHNKIRRVTVTQREYKETVTSCVLYQQLGGW
jgi:hypothetical protein